jgi:hypothetical protein
MPGLLNNSIHAVRHKQNKEILSCKEQQQPTV